MARKHGDPLRPHICTVCDRSYAALSSLKYHQGRGKPCDPDLHKGEAAAEGTNKVAVYSPFVELTSHGQNTDSYLSEPVGEDEEAGNQCRFFRFIHRKSLSSLGIRKLKP